MRGKSQQDFSRNHGTVNGEMTNHADCWIVIPKWDEFQHYTDGRRLKWIRAWTNVLDNDDFLALSFHLRGVLHSLWVAYATAEGQLRASPQTLHRQLGGTVKIRDLEALNHAGFLRFSGTKPDRIRTTDKKREDKNTRAVTSVEDAQPSAESHLEIADVIEISLRGAA